MLHFFLSYAHGAPEDDARVRAFFDHLSTEIRLIAGYDADAVVGFHDNGVLRVGDDWPVEITDALGHAQTMVALCSRRYFHSEYCRQELATFNERLHGAGPGTIRQGRLIPIFWVLTPLPDFLDRIHHKDDRFPPAYHHDGLRELLRDNGRDYRKFVLALAQRICEISSRGGGLAPSAPRGDFRRISSPFNGGAPMPNNAVAVPSPRPSSPDEQPDRSPGPEDRVGRWDRQVQTRPILRLEPSDE